MTKKRHHYLPQCYLKGFTNPEDKIWTYKKADPQSPFLNAIDSTAVERYFYRFEIEGKEDELEDFLSEQVESRCCDSLEKLRNKQFPTGDERKNLAAFFSILYVRTPRHVEYLTAQQNKELNIYAKLNASNKQSFHDSYRLVHPDLDEETIEEDRQSILTGDVAFEMKREIILNQMLQAGAIYSFPLAEMKWILLETDEENPFVTSDNPLSVFHPQYQPFNFYKPSLGMRDTKVAIPVSKDLILMLFNDERVSDGKILSVKDARLEAQVVTWIKDLREQMINTFYLNCHKFVFSSTDKYKARFVNFLAQAQVIEEITSQLTNQNVGGSGEDS
ncbi:MAG: DUF4238 domain-containing protein [Gammaproteobacteria bacterium]